MLTHILGDHFQLLEVVLDKFLPLFIGAAYVRKTSLKNNSGLTQFLLSRALSPFNLVVLHCQNLNFLFESL